MNQRLWNISYLLPLLLATVFLSPFIYANNQEKTQAVMLKAEAGDAESQYILSNLYHQGVGIEQDVKKSFTWIKASAEQGYAAAQFDLASKYDVGDGVQKNLSKAAHWYEKSARKGEAAAAYNLALMYEEAQGVPLDLYQAYAWLEVGALMGFEQAKMSRQQLGARLNEQQLEQAEKQAAKLINEIRNLAKDPEENQ